MSPRVRTFTIAVAIVVLLVSGIPGPATASPAPIPVCGPCGQPFDYVADTHGVEVTVERSTATVHVHENGSATWTVRNRIASQSAVERLRANASLVDRIVAATLDVRGVREHEHRFLRASITPDGVVTMRYRTPNFASWTNGALRVEYFRERPGAYVYTGLGADRLTVIGPSGTAVTKALSGATVDGRTLTMTSFETRGDGPFVVFVPAGDPLGGARTFVAVASAVAPYVARNVALFVLLPTGVLAGLTWSVARTIEHVDPSTTLEQARFVGAIVAVLGFLAALHPWYADAVPFIGGYEPSLLAGSIATAVIGVVAMVVPERFALRFQYVAIAVALGVGTLAVLTAPGRVPGGHVPSSLGVSVLLPLPSVLALPVGYAGNDGPDRLRYATAALPAGSLAAGVVYQFPLSTAGGPMFVLGAVLLVVYAVGVVVFGAPLFALGAVLSGIRDDHATRTGTSGT